jgi:hypothetical protein
MNPYEDAHERLADCYHNAGPFVYKYNNKAMVSMPWMNDCKDIQTLTRRLGRNPAEPNRALERFNTTKGSVGRAHQSEITIDDDNSSILFLLAAATTLMLVCK